MFPRLLCLRQFEYFTYISLFAIVTIVYVSITSSGYIKPLQCSKINISSTPTPTTTERPLTANFNHSEDEKTSIDDNSIWCLDMAHRLDTELTLEQSPILHSPPVNSTKLSRLPYRYSLWKSSPRLPRIFTPCEHHIAMRLLMITERLCRKHGIRFMLSDGSLLDSYRHHDIIPWDDDLDTMIPIEQKELFITAMKQMNGTLIQSCKFPSETS